jgi:hypothetical protein
MIISTDLPNDEERAASLAAVPWRQSILDLAGEIAASFDNNALDLIDASIGPNHCRAALVALLDAVGVLRSATIALANSLLEQRVFSRVHPTDPLNPTEPLERVMNLDENRIEMRIPRSAWFPRDLCFPYS